MQRLNRPVVLYLGVLDGNFVQEMKLAGVRRYAAARGWEVVPVRKALSTPKRLGALLLRYRPVGCIVECFGDATQLRPALFGRIPAVWLDFTPDTADAGDPFGRPCVSVDEEAVARAALRELSANRVESIAVVEFQNPLPWSHVRAGAFRRLAVAEGRECCVFEARDGERAPSRIRRLSRWLTALPRPCGVFAVNDVAAAEVRDACRAALLDIPREIAIVGVDNSPSFCEVSDRPSTSIRIDFERMGYLAAKILGDIIGCVDCCRQTRRRGETEFGGDLRASTPPSSVLGGSKAFAIGPLLAVRRRSTSGRGRREPRILEAVEMIRREACSGLTAESLMKRFPCSRRLFEMRFREATGHSILDEILHVRLEKAFTLLSETDTAIGAIYAYCGFESSRALDYLFHSRFKTSMREWRKRNARK